MQWHWLAPRVRVGWGRGTGRLARMEGRWEGRKNAERKKVQQLVTLMGMDIN